MDMNFSVTGVMSVDESKYDFANETPDGVFELECSSGKIYSLSVAVEVFDPTTSESTFIVGYDALREAGFNVYDYSDIQWEFENLDSENSSEGLNVNDLS
jgi:hypothetical protein